MADHRSKRLEQAQRIYNAMAKKATKQRQVVEYLKGKTEYPVWLGSWDKLILAEIGIEWNDPAKNRVRKDLIKMGCIKFIGAKPFVGSVYEVLPVKPTAELLLAKTDAKHLGLGRPPRPDTVPQTPEWFAKHRAQHQPRTDFYIRRMLWKHQKMTRDEVLGKIGEASITTLRALHDAEGGLCLGFVLADFNPAWTDRHVCGIEHLDTEPFHPEVMVKFRSGGKSPTYEIVPTEGKT
jgi:hypothetical protein